MLASSRVEGIWLRLLRQSSAPEAIDVAKIEEGYYAVVRQAATSGPGSLDLDRASGLESLIPNLSATRAVYLNQQSAYGFSDAMNVRAWVGALAEPIERGSLQAFAVVDPEVLARHVRSAVQASGWKVESAAPDLRVSDGQFTENLNLLRAIVQMVLSRADFAEAAAALQAELSNRFARDRGLFARFAERFRNYQPAVFDRYFTTYPECSCVAAGWDYWQVAGRSDKEAADLFEQGIKDLESFLATPSDDWLWALAADCCNRNTTEN